MMPQRQRQGRVPASKESREALLERIASLESSAEKYRTESRNRQHEFRSQLHTILGYARLIPRQSRAITVTEIADTIAVAGHRLLAMVDDGVMHLPNQPAEPGPGSLSALPGSGVAIARTDVSTPSSGNLAAAPGRRLYVGAERTILIAEDTQENIILLRTLLEDMGFRVLIARSGAEAVSLLDAGVDLVLTDQKMAHGSGWDVLRVSMDAAPSRPVILLSGDLPVRPRRLPGRYAFTRTLQKPADHRQILKSVGDVLQLEWHDVRRPARRADGPDGTDAAPVGFAIPLPLRAELARLTGLGLVTDIHNWANDLLSHATSGPEMAFAEAVIFAADRLDFPRLVRLSTA